MPDFSVDLWKENLSARLLKIIGINIRNRRKELGMTQSQLSEKVGGNISPATVSRHENGGDHMNVGTLMAYAHALLTSVHELMADPVLKDKIAVTPEYYDLSDADRAKADEYIIRLWNESAVVS